MKYLLLCLLLLLPVSAQPQSRSKFFTFKSLTKLRKMKYETYQRTLKKCRIAFAWVQQKNLSEGWEQRSRRKKKRLTK